MAITSLAATDNGDGTFTLSFASDLGEPTYYIYLDGVLVSAQTGSTYTTPVVTVQWIVEVYDDPDTEPAEVFPSYFTIGWPVSSDCAYYRVEQYVAGEWTALATLDAGDSAWRSYTTGLLDDETSHQFRVIPIDVAGNDGTSISFTKTMVRHPDAPTVTYAYIGGSTNTVTITAA